MAVNNMNGNLVTALSVLGFGHTGVIEDCDGRSWLPILTSVLTAHSPAAVESGPSLLIGKFDLVSF